MRKVVSHLIMTSDGVVKFDVVIDTIMKYRNAEEVLPDFFAKVAEEDAMLLGRVTYQEWADYWPASTHEPFASHINNVPKYVVNCDWKSTPWLLAVARAYFRTGVRSNNFNLRIRR